MSYVYVILKIFDVQRLLDRHPLGFTLRFSKDVE